MADSTLSEQPRRTVKAWSPAAISSGTLCVMLILAVPGIILGLVSISTALALGASAGVIASAVNCFRLGRRWTGLVQLLISPLIYLIFPVGLPLALATLVKVLAGSPEHLHEVYQIFTPLLVFILYWGAAGLICFYLYHFTQRQIASVQVRGTLVKFAATRSLSVVFVVSCMCVWDMSNLTTRAYLDSIPGGIYCDFLEAYKPQPEMSPERVEFYSDPTPSREIYFPASEKLAYQQLFVWNDRLNHLWLWVGYDTNGNLAWRIKGRDLADRFSSCPWTLSQSVTAR